MSRIVHFRMMRSSAGLRIMPLACFSVTPLLDTKQKDLPIHIHVHSPTGLSIMLDYFNMLVAMTFNIGLFVAVVGGYALGALLFSHMPENYSAMLKARRNSCSNSKRAASYQAADSASELEQGVLKSEGGGDGKGIVAAVAVSTAAAAAVAGSGGSSGSKGLMAGAPHQAATWEAMPAKSDSHTSSDSMHDPVNGACCD
jgi:hypothetical protein